MSVLRTNIIINSSHTWYGFDETVADVQKDSRVNISGLGFSFDWQWSKFTQEFWEIIGVV